MVTSTVSYRFHMTTEQVASEEDLIMAAKADPKSFEPLYNKYYDPIFRFVYQRIERKELAADVTSQVFLKALLNIPKYEHRGLPFNSWLFRIAQNELTNQFRQNKMERVVNIDTAGVTAIADDMHEDHYESYQQKLMETLAKLMDEELDLVEMRYFEKRSFKEMGEILKITENSAKVKLYRLLDKLRRQIIKK